MKRVTHLTYFHPLFDLPVKLLVRSKVTYGVHELQALILRRLEWFPRSLPALLGSAVAMLESVLVFSEPREH